MIPTLAVLIGLAAGLSIAAPLPAPAAERPARPRLCPEDAPEGVRLPPQPGCGSREIPAPRRDSGFHEILPGTGIRIGGHASSSFDTRR